MGIVARIKQYIDSKGISISSFEQKIGASDGMMRRAIKNDTDIQAKWITSISENYHDLNIEWLVTGAGSMLKYTEEEYTKELHSSLIPGLLEELKQLSFQLGERSKEIEFLQERLAQKDNHLENNELLG